MKKAFFVPILVLLSIGLQAQSTTSLKDVHTKNGIRYLEQKGVTKWVDIPQCELPKTRLEFRDKMETLFNLIQLKTDVQYAQYFDTVSSQGCGATIDYSVAMQCLVLNTNLFLSKL